MSNKLVTSKKNWMRIFLKSNWKNRVFKKTKIYSFEIRDRELMNKIFDELHEQKRMSWTNVFIFFNYSIFCVWKKNVVDESKNRMIVNIRDLNVIIVSNAYSLFLQFDIIIVVRDCFYISLIDASIFFINDAFIQMIDTNSSLSHIKNRNFSMLLLWNIKIRQFTYRNK